MHLVKIDQVREKEGGDIGEMRNRTIAIAVLLLAPTFLISVTATVPYDPWCDMDDDGDIDIYDVVEMADRYGTAGASVNKTALLYEVNGTFTGLLGRIAGVEDSVFALGTQMFFMQEDLVNAYARITQLEQRVDEFSALIAYLNETVALLNSTTLGAPDYDSGWVSIPGYSVTRFTHGLGTTNVCVYVARNDTTYGINDGQHEINWSHLSNNDVWITSRYLNGTHEIRVMIWKIPQP